MMTDVPLQGRPVVSQVCAPYRHPQEGPQGVSLTIMELALVPTLLIPAAILLWLHLTHLIPYPPFPNWDLGLLETCGSFYYACSYGTGIGATCLRGECRGFTAACDHGFIDDTWIGALSNCTQPQFWPYFVCASFGFWALARSVVSFVYVVNPRDRGWLALTGLATFGAMMGLCFASLTSYWCLLSLSLVSASWSHAHEFWFSGKYSLDQRSQTDGKQAPPSVPSDS